MHSQRESLTLCIIVSLEFKIPLLNKVYFTPGEITIAECCGLMKSIKTEF